MLAATMTNPSRTLFLFSLYFGRVAATDACFSVARASLDEEYLVSGGDDRKASASILQPRLTVIS
jgi:hypothetical protein